MSMCLFVCACCDGLLWIFATVSIYMFVYCHHSFPVPLIARLMLRGPEINHVPARCSLRKKNFFFVFFAAWASTTFIRPSLTTTSCTWSQLGDVILIQSFLAFISTQRGIDISTQLDLYPFKAAFIHVISTQSFISTQLDIHSSIILTRLLAYRQCHHLLWISHIGNQYITWMMMRNWSLPSSHLEIEG